VLALQSIASRNADPTEQIVVSVTSFETSSKAFNVIAQRVHMKGTVRTMSPELRKLGQERLTAIAETTAQAYGAEAKVNYIKGYPVMINHGAETEFAAEVAREISGDCAEAPLIMGGEDFAYMLEERPGAYILVGNGDTASVHHPEYDFSDEAIPTGCSWWAGIVERRMPAA
jgi:hippurate hydrolase